MRRFLRQTRLFLLIASAVALVAVGTSWLIGNRPTHVLCKDCNIVFISIDTLGAKHTSVYDPSLDTTPHLKALAEARGIVFDHAYSASSWTLPAHTALFTGRYPWEFNVWEANDRLPDSATTLFEALKNEGYATAGFATGSFVEQFHNMVQGIDEFHYKREESDWNDLPELFVAGAKWLREHQGKRPFVLFMRPFEVHDPYGQPNASSTVTIHDIVRVNTQPGGATTLDAEKFKDAYRKEIRISDDALDAFMASLDSSPYGKNTIVVITSDHGEEFGEHGSTGVHGVTLYNEVIHVPLIVIVPGLPARRVVQTVETRSIPATLMELVGHARKEEFPGTSLVPMLEGRPMQNQLALSRTATDKMAMLSRIEAAYDSLDAWGTTLTAHDRNTFSNPYTSSAVLGKWHLIRNKDGSFEVYDLSVDPDEHTNLYNELSNIPLEDQRRIGQLVSLLTLRVGE